MENVQNHRFTFNEPMPVESCTQAVCDLSLQFGEDDDGGGGSKGMVCPPAAVVDQADSHVAWQRCLALQVAVVGQP